MLPPSAHTLIDALQSAYDYPVSAEDVGQRMSDVAALRLYSAHQQYRTVGDVLESVRAMHEAMEAEARRAHTLMQRMDLVESTMTRMQSELDALRNVVVELTAALSD